MNRLRVPWLWFVAAGALAAVVSIRPAGARAVQAAGADGASGVALVEIFDLGG